MSFNKPHTYLLCCSWFFLRYLLLCNRADPVAFPFIWFHAPGSCPNLMMSRNEQQDVRSSPLAPLAPSALTPQLPPRVHRPLCLSVSSDSNGRFKTLETQEWKNNLKAQVVTDSQTDQNS